MSKEQRTTVHRGTLLRSFGYAFEGLWELLSTQRNARIHAAITLLVLLLALLLQISRAEWMILILTIGVVLSAEAINTALEALVDLVSPALHPLAKRAKDVGAAAVLLVAISAAIVGALIFLPRLIQLLG